MHWFRSRVDESFTEASWWELTVLPMMAYMIWAILYYFKVSIDRPVHACSSTLVPIIGIIDAILARMSCML